MGLITPRSLALVLNAARCIVGRSRSDRAALRGVDTERNPREQAIFQAVTKISVLEEWVDTICSRLLSQNAIIGVLSEFLGVVTVWRESVGVVDQILIEKGLSDVRRRNIISEGAVGVDRDIRVDENVDVCRTARVVSREYSLKLSNTFCIGLLDTTQEGLIEVTRIA